MPTVNTPPPAEETPVTPAEAETPKAKRSPRAKKVAPVVLETDEMMPEGWERSALSSDLDPGLQEEEWCLFLYDPLALGRGKESEHSIIIPVKVNCAEAAPKLVTVTLVDGSTAQAYASDPNTLNTYEYKVLSRGLQRIRRKDAQQILQCDVKGVVEKIRRNIIKYWSDEWDLSKMTENDAVEAIRRCEQKTLIGLWMENIQRYTKPVQEDLRKRQAELETPPTFQQM